MVINHNYGGFMKRIFILTLFFFLFLVTQSLGSDSDIETRLKALEETIKNQQMIIEKQQQEINDLKALSSGVKTSQADKTLAAKDTQEKGIGRVKGPSLGMAYPTSPMDQKFSQIPKPLEVYSFSQSKFVPDISFILDGSYLARNVNDETFGKLTVPELILPGMSSPNSGFNLNYGELSLFSPIDPYFDLTATIPFTESGVELE